MQCSWLRLLLPHPPSWSMWRFHQLGQAIRTRSFSATFKEGSLDLEWWMMPMPSGIAGESDFPKAGQQQRANSFTLLASGCSPGWGQAYNWTSFRGSHKGPHYFRCPRTKFGFCQNSCLTLHNNKPRMLLTGEEDSERSWSYLDLYNLESLLDSCSLVCQKGKVTSQRQGRIKSNHS